MFNNDLIKITIDHNPVVNYALYQNGLPIIRSITINNNSLADLEDVQIRISASSAFCLEYIRPINIIPSASELVVRDINIVLDPTYLFSLTEKETALLKMDLYKDDILIRSESISITVLAFNEWHGYHFMPELLASFVIPNHPVINNIVARVAEFMQEWTGDPSLDGYQSKDANRVLHYAGAVYKALQEMNIVYAMPPASFEFSGQRVRLCDEVCSTKMGTCLDLSLLYTSCIEAIGLNPLLIIKKGHIFAGVWLEDSTFPESVQDDPSLLTKRLADGSQVISVVECTLFTAGRAASYDSACATANKELQSVSSIECFIDIHRARLSHISPLPIRIETPEGWKIETPNIKSIKLTDAPHDVARIVDVTQDSTQTFSKKDLWERKLLDLGMRNNMLNLRLTKTMIPILSASLDDLEDVLADGKDISIRSRPADWTPINGKVDLEHLHIVEGYTDLLHSEFKNGRIRSALTETDIANTLKNMYRSAKVDMEENGANTLYLALGMLKWYETDRSTQARYAPLLLLPIEMVRKSAAEGYVVRLRDDEVQMNITLLEKLHQDFSLDIKGLDPLPLDEKGVDTRRVFAIVRNAVMDQKRWDVLESAVLGIFSFSQFVMWNDIHNRTKDLARSKVVRSLMDNHLAWDAEDMIISDHVPEEGVLLPIPADASQLYAIESAADGNSFVLHGPPGTGKSQTITALIANVLSRGKTILFVAEKKAALEVVQKRLESIGLAPFCLELHSNKAKKKDVLEQLKQASEVSKYQSTGEYVASVKRIKSLRNDLNRYAEALHKTQNCGMSLYSIIHDFQQYRAFPEIDGFSSAFFSKLTRDRIYDMEVIVEDLVAAGRDTGHPHNNPLTTVMRKDYSQSLKQSAIDKAGLYLTRLFDLNEKVKRFSEMTGKDDWTSFEQIGKLSFVADCLIEMEAYPDAWVLSNNPPEYLEKVKSLAFHRIGENNQKSFLSERWNESFFELNGQYLHDDYVQKSNKWFVSKLIGMHQLRKQLLDSSKGPINKDSFGSDLEHLVEYQNHKKLADQLFSEIGNDLDNLYKGESTDWSYITGMSEKAKVSFSKIDSIDGNDELRIRYGTDKETLKSAKGVTSGWNKLFGIKNEIYSLLDLLSYMGDNWISEEIARCDAIIDNADNLREWVIWNKAVDVAKQAGLDPLVKAYVSGMEHDSVLPAFRKTIYKGLAIEAIDSDESLNFFSGNDFNRKIQQFEKIDKELVDLAKSEIYCKLASQVPNFTSYSVGNSETGILQRAIRSGGRGISIRKLFEQIPNLLPKLCPCMLMSPISVAQYLDPNRKPFDLVVFDEASQLPTSKAVGALARGENAVIVGDPNQMPPTSFFASNVSDEDSIEEEDLESILDDCLALNMPQTHLLWHYRSSHESLIAFSNSRFYDNKLYTFPSVNDRESRVHMVHVDGVFDRGGKRTNQAEAEAVVKEIIRRCYDKTCSDKSVGVVTFNISQQNLIDDLLTEACKNDSQLEEWAYNSKEPVFIKNLENVQGDERDVILFSIGYGPDKSGKVTMNFGPLNRDGGWRRLNVAVSRARYEMIVYATLTPDQIDLSRTASEGVAALKEFMEFAESNHLVKTETNAGITSNDTDGVSLEICKVLHDKGYETDCLIGESAYKVDIGVIDPKNPDKYLLGILLDGRTYKTAKTTRDREIAQINVLKGLGWRITRVWTMDWWENSQKVIERLLEEIRIAELTSIRNTDENSESQNEKHYKVDTKYVEKLENFFLKLKGKREHKEQETSKTKPLLKGIVEKKEQSNYNSKSYIVTSLNRTYMNPEDFVVYSRSHRNNVAQKVIEVIRTEGPISESLLTKRVIQSYNISRAGNRIQGFMRWVFDSLKLVSTEHGNETFYWSKFQDPKEYREYRVGDEPDNKRDIKDIPVEEAANAVCGVLEEQFSLPKEDLIRAAANKMGFSRIGTSVSALFFSGITLAIKDKRIIRAENGNLMLK
jgi:hypothetical protein